MVDKTVSSLSTQSLSSNNFQSLRCATGLLTAFAVSSPLWLRRYTARHDIGPGLAAIVHYDAFALFPFALPSGSEACHSLASKSSCRTVYVCDARFLAPCPRDMKMHSPLKLYAWVSTRGSVSCLRAVSRSAAMHSYFAASARQVSCWIHVAIFVCWSRTQLEARRLTNWSPTKVMIPSGS